jgi:hypothetical protein
MFGRYGPVVKAHDELDEARDIGREGRVSFVTMVFAEGRAVFMELDSEGLIDLIDRSADDDASSGGIGFAYL